MRDIKFRAWNGKIMLFMGRGGYCDFEIAGGDVFVCGTFDFVKKDYPLMQFTGLQDKNGTDIYEGDIVMAGNELFVVKFWMGNSCLCSSGHETGMPIYPYNVNNRIEVVDNIHQNPELIEAA